jgi:ketosteroid isomerase-like protein
MSDFVKKMTSSAKELAETLADKAEDAFEVISDKTEDAIEVVKERGSELRERAQASLRETPALNRAKAMYAMVGEGKLMDAFEKYYHEDVVVQENSHEPRRGKAATREFDEQFMSSIKEMHGGGVGAITSNEANNVTMVESWADITFNDGKRKKLEEVAVQHWQGDKIIRERFYYSEA